jgi:hypothetical protein
MSDNGGQLMYRLDEKPFGKTWSEWTIEWWKWLLSIQEPDNPANDDSGKNFYQNQKNSDVLFLAGTKGGGAERNITIPAGKAILLPVINFTTSFLEEPYLKSDSELILRAKSDIDDIVKKQAAIDGKNLQGLERYRIASPPFDLTLPEKNLYRLPPGPTRGISDGYWIFLRPLTPGKHHIYAAGSCSSGRTSVSISYHVTVKE